MIPGSWFSQKQPGVRSTTFRTHSSVALQIPCGTDLLQLRHKRLHPGQIALEQSPSRPAGEIQGTNRRGQRHRIPRKPRSVPAWVGTEDETRDASFVTQRLIHDANVSRVLISAAAGGEKCTTNNRMAWTSCQVFEILEARP